MCSVIGFGGFAIGGTDWYGTSEERSREALITAYESGVNFFDTSNAYGWGRSEELIGDVLRNHRQQIIIATKGGIAIEHRDFARKNFNPNYLSRSLHESLRRLRTDYIDLCQLHSPKAEDLTGDVVGFLEDIVKKGKARYVGISISDEATGMRALGIPVCRSLQVYFNILEQSLRKRLFSAARENDVGLVGRVPLYSGFLSGRYSVKTVFGPDDHRSRWDPDHVKDVLWKVEQLKECFVTPQRSLSQLALAFVISHPGITVVIPGSKSAEQVKANVSAADIMLTQEELASLHRFWEDSYVPANH